MEKKISVVIPNYNGSQLLKKNLGAVIQNCPGCQIIVVDDASTDDSVDFVQNNYKPVKLIRLLKNRGFAFAANAGVKNAGGDYILLLNSDVSPRANFLEPVLTHFKDNELFAVGLADYSHEGKFIIVRGRGGGAFKKGFLKHFMLPAKSGKTLWVSGGSGLFDKKKYLELGGFDTNFAPFYWEDIDLSFRAWQMGYMCMFEPKSKVDHFHKEGAIQKSHSEFFVKTISYKNQFIFVWKNISDYLWLAQHLLWFPYHFAKAIANLDFAFFVGFLWAVSKIPSLVVSSQLSSVRQVFDRESQTESAQYDPEFTEGSSVKCQVSDREVLNKYAKP
ncbi:hypothetical protein A2165_02755 [Candidatus Curtissbacteria bacterium RBG_13_40_7]|uniref:Glycosyltransferase 2-like domain-containing protein n=1 Tax=Candidatus Curtissbacteria bacterium RBG_13_40_7 TaxID=1797706 RepID=A0A1F5FV75_9BACT|nr:MAG: hypothetical protein A2165_02755 [Candidatus Curtissbacteria bacterium RBG_13_40_7]